MKRALLWLSLLLTTSAVYGQGAVATPAPPAAPPATSAPAVPAVSPAPAPAESAPASDDQPKIQLERKGDDGKVRTIRILKTGSDEAGIAVTCTPQDDEPAGSPSVVVYSDSSVGGVQVTVDKNVIRAPLAIITKQGQKEDQKEGEGGGDGHIEVSAGTARFLDAAPEGKTDRLSRCAVEATPTTSPNTVFVTQGKTNLRGQKLIYDEKDGIARIDGPITFERPAPEGETDADRLSGTSQRIEVNVDNETTTLAGEVVLTSGERTSKAERVDYDDAKNVAILRGSPGKPAQSVKGKDILCAAVIRYYLDTNNVDVIASKDESGAITGTITGSFSDGDEATSSSSSGSSSNSSGC
ncbi:LptA/OstA family protein [Deinococcus sp.]|uniref:LptA/OstA family protein n=1 Tax=Deinococcus sp. TaxID=47478 RepID=UPI0026003053|nr:LptA/OstA family protein [Deinococcus sp.]